MKYALLLDYAPRTGPRLDSPEFEAEMGQWSAVTDEMTKAGTPLANVALQPIDAATTLRARNGSVVLTDGPFAETKEILFASYLLDRPDFDTAAAWAATDHRTLVSRRLACVAPPSRRGPSVKPNTTSRATAASSKP